MAHIRTIDMMLLDDLFDMGKGFVLDFSDKTMARFFATELNIDIDDSIYKKHGTSKAKRLRCFLESVDTPTVIRTLRTLWEYRQALSVSVGTEEKMLNAEGRFLDLLNRIQGLPGDISVQQTPKQAFDRPRLARLKDSLITMSTQEPQKRGYAFEAFLKELFEVYGLKPRASFRIIGEQIDGSFDLSNEIYLLEAKWQGPKIGAAELHTFHGKLDQKAAWTRGLFVSQSGFTEEGLAAFGRGKKVICMDGLDMYEILNREIPLTDVLERKIRRAAETGKPFIPIRELFNH